MAVDFLDRYFINTIMKKNDLFIVWSPNYGAWLFTTSDKAWKFMEDANCLLGNKTTWNIDKTPEEVIKSWHHPWELCILERIDKDVKDLMEIVKELDGIDWSKVFEIING